MAKVPAIIPVSDLRQDAARVLNDVKSSAEPVFITQQGPPTAVLMSLDVFERFEAERELLLMLVRETQRSPRGSATPSTTSLPKPTPWSRVADRGHSFHSLRAGSVSLCGRDHSAGQSRRCSAVPTRGGRHLKRLSGSPNSGTVVASFRNSPIARSTSSPIGSSIACATTRSGSLQSGTAPRCPTIPRAHRARAAASRDNR